MIPMCEPGHDQSVKILEQRLERLGIFGRLIGEARQNITGRELREDREGREPLAIVGDPSRHPFGGGDKGVAAHVMPPRPARRPVRSDCSPMRRGYTSGPRLSSFPVVHTRGARG